MASADAGAGGVGEAAQIITQQALFGQEAPAHLHATPYGVLAFTGTFSVVIISAVSGVLFDKVGPTAPFVLAGVLHLIFLPTGLGFMKWRSTRLAVKETGSGAVRPAANP